MLSQLVLPFLKTFEIKKESYELIENSKKIFDTYQMQFLNQMLLYNKSLIHTVNNIKANMYHIENNSIALKVPLKYTHEQFYSFSDALLYLSSLIKPDTIIVGWHAAKKQKSNTEDIARWNTNQLMKVQIGMISSNHLSYDQDGFSIDFMNLPEDWIIKTGLIYDYSSMLQNIDKMKDYVKANEEKTI